MGTTDNSSANFGTSAPEHCACCHAYGQVTAHWDLPDVKICDACRHLLFTFEAHGALVHTAYQFSLRLNRGGL